MWFEGIALYVSIDANKVSGAGLHPKHSLSKHPLHIVNMKYNVVGGVPDVYVGQCRSNDADIMQTPVTARITLE